MKSTIHILTLSALVLTTLSAHAQNGYWHGWPTPSAGSGGSYDPFRGAREALEQQRQLNEQAERTRRDIEQRRLQQEQAAQAREEERRRFEDQQRRQDAIWRQEEQLRQQQSEQAAAEARMAELERQAESERQAEAARLEAESEGSSASGYSAANSTTRTAEDQRQADDRALRVIELRRWRAEQEALANSEESNSYDPNQQFENNGQSSPSPQGGSNLSILAGDREAAAMREQQRREWVQASNRIWNQGKKNPWGEFGKAVDRFDESSRAAFEAIVNTPASESERPILLPDGTVSTLKEKAAMDDRNWLLEINSPIAK